MKKMIELITNEVEKAFLECDYSSQFGKTTLSNRPDLCQYQCNGALAAAKVHKKAPMIIASEVCEHLKKTSQFFKEVNCVKPGFINLILHDHIVVDYLQNMSSHSKYGCEEIGDNNLIVVDYGGANMAKPLHIGHLRSAIIGESIKRLGAFLGYDMLGDVHLGDWGLQIGLIIAQLEETHPEWAYFIDDYEGDYPTEAPFTISELEQIYPAASSFAKANPCFMEKAKEATYTFQKGHKGYVELWKQISKVSIEDLKKNYSSLNVHFELWKKESDVQEYINPMIEDLKKRNIAYISDGALVVDVKEETDKREMPPCILVKSDGATLYGTTDLATIVERVELFNPSEVIYIVDKRQEMHFEQVFRSARKASILPEETQLTFLGFGTMNGKDGKPFKTRDGGVMRLEKLVKDISDTVLQRVETESIAMDEAKDIANKVGLAALKYADLSNQISKDYVFDLDRFTSFEGNTGPYILYTVVRIHSILSKSGIHDSVNTEPALQEPSSATERSLMLQLIQFNDMVTSSFEDRAPHKICQYIYQLSNDFNKFYHHNKILTEKDSLKKASWLQLINLTKDVLVCCLDLLGIDAPDRM